MWNNSPVGRIFSKLMLSSIAFSLFGTIVVIFSLNITSVNKLKYPLADSPKALPKSSNKYSFGYLIDKVAISNFIWKPLDSKISLTSGILNIFTKIEARLFNLPTLPTLKSVTLKIISSPSTCNLVVKNNLVLKKP